MNKRLITSTVLVAVTVVSPYAAQGCPAAAPHPLTNTINADDGTHVFGDFGKFKYNKRLSPYGAGGACTWRITVQNQGKAERQIDHGDEFSSFVVDKPSSQFTIVRLYSTSCGSWG